MNVLYIYYFIKTWDDTKMHFIEFIEALGHVAEYKKWADLEEVLLILL